jgi:aminopeptidase N
MKKILILSACLFLIMPLSLHSQIFFDTHTKQNKKPPFKGEKPKINDLKHTELKIRFHPEEHTMDGEANITLRPHFYPVDSLTLDAKSMQIHEVKVDGRPVRYHYDGQKIHIRLPETYTSAETYKVYIKYTAQPDSVKTEGGTAISDNRGLYFINTRNETDAYPPQIWTQGEPESASAWFPTIDSPNQKSTEKIEVTVPSEWVSLSNGKMIASYENNDGTRTDVWVQEKPHAPYLFFVGTGPFAIVKDSLGKLPVWYYVEKKYEPVARQIFGKTPEMIRYFSRLTGVPYPWDKYHQIVVREFVSGAMENTTAVSHSSMAYRPASKLIDNNPWEDVIAHELFHHWFGDLVTAESWAQISMNESFADYSESLWEEHDEGPDKADMIRDRKRKMYLQLPGSKTKNLVRFHYHRPDDVFDVISYQKGGLILHMLRNYVGDSAFFKGLNLYLKRNAYKTGEAARLRLALEEVSGMDLTEFFNQWFYGSGNPVLDIRYKYNDTTGKAKVIITQKTKKIWKFPLQIDIYEGNSYRSHPVFVRDSITEFLFSYHKRPDLINVGARHILLAEITDHRPAETYYFQFFHAKNYMDRKAGLEKAIENKNKSREAFRVIAAALNDPFYAIRVKAVKALDIKSPYFNKKIEHKLTDMALYDRKTLVQAAAIEKLGELKKKKYLTLFKKQLQSPSYSIKTAAFKALAQTDQKEIFKIITPQLESELGSAILKLYVENKRDDKMVFVAQKLFEMDLTEFFSPANRKITEKATRWISRSDNLEANRMLADKTVEFGLKYKKYGLGRIALFMLLSYKNNQKENNGIHRQDILKQYEEAIKKIKAAF